NPLPGGNQEIQHHSFRRGQAPRPGHDPQNGHAASRTGCPGQEAGDATAGAVIADFTKFKTTPACKAAPFFSSVPRANQPNRLRQGTGKSSITWSSIYI